MITVQAFKMRIVPGMIEEYQARHDNIWPGIVKILKQNGVLDYSIFYDHDESELVAHISFAEGFSPIEFGKYEVMRRWWTYMSDIVASNSDNVPMMKVLPLVFHMDQHGSQIFND